jgi:hypothetical protein
MSLLKAVLPVTALLLGAVGSSAWAQQDGFAAACTLPPAASGAEREVDRACGLAGDAPEPEHQAQNRAKNNR